MKLITGGTIPDSEVTFDPNTYRFTYAGQDITNQISRAEKLRAVPGFDIERENIRLSLEKPVSGDGVAPTGGQIDNADLDDSTLSNLGSQLLNNPFQAPLEAANRLAEQFFALPGLKKVMIVAAVGAVLYIAVKKA